MCLDVFRMFLHTANMLSFCFSFPKGLRIKEHLSATIILSLLSMHMTTNSF